jgi:hypothetical protein
MSDKQYAKYIGTAGRRHMPFRDWAKLGIEQKTLSWTPTNGYTVPRSDICDEAWLIIQNDPGMVVIGDARDAEAIRAASIQAAVNRLRSRQAGQDVLHAGTALPVDVDAPAGRTGGGDPR